jgi:signal transduction histidine kinase
MRLILAALGLCAAVAAVALGLLYGAAHAIIAAETRQVVTAELAGLSDDYARRGPRGLARAIARRVEDAADRDAVYLLADARGTPVAGNLARWPEGVTPGEGWVEVRLRRTDSGRQVRVAAASLALPGGERLLVGRDAEGLARFDRALVVATALALAVAAALSLGAGWLLSRLVFNRVAALDRVARGVGSDDLSRRAPVSGAGDEMDRLATSLNAMLDRIETLVEGLRTATDSLAHDLRSPLTRLRGQIGALSDAATPAAAREVAGARAQREIDHLLRVLETLTQIAHAEAGLGRDAFEPVDAAALCADLADLYGPAAAEKDVTLTLSAPEAGPAIRGHAALLAQALSNLIENALRYAPAGSAIALGAEEAAGVVRLWVADAGPGVPAADRPRVMRRFETMDPARAARGAGLGLALAAAVARLHGGALSLHDAAPGLLARLELPPQSAE